jgi:molecular chaperone DnaK (HSP70)
MADPRMAVGIDLGTTNSLLAYVELDAVADGGSPSVQFLAIPQVVSPGETEALESLPSFVYLTNEQERQAGDWRFRLAAPRR